MLNVNTRYSLNVNRISLNNRNNANAVATNPSQSVVSFKAITYTAHPVIRTKMTSKEEQEKYNVLTANLDKNYRNKLNFALKSGRLLNNVSEDKNYSKR